MEKPDVRKRKTKEVGMFLFENGGYRIPKSSPKKVRENSCKILFDRTKQKFVSINSNCICRSEDFLAT